MKDKAIGIYYVEMPNNIIRGMFGEEVEPKNNKGNKFIIQNRKQISVKNLPKFTESELKDFKSIFCMNFK